MDPKEELTRLMRTLNLELCLASGSNQLCQLQIAAAPSNTMKIRSGRRTRQRANSLEVTLGIVKKTFQKAEQIFEETKTPRTPENVFLAMLAVISYVVILPGANGKV